MLFKLFKRDNAAPAATATAAEATQPEPSAAPAEPAADATAANAPTAETQTSAPPSTPAAAPRLATVTPLPTARAASAKETSAKDAATGDTTPKDASSGDAAAGEATDSVIQPATVVPLTSRSDTASTSHPQFKTTDDLTPARAPFGLSEALQSLRLALAAARPARGHHVLVTAPDGTDLLADVVALTAEASQLPGFAATPPGDWVYAHNWASPARPRLLRLAAGEGHRLDDGLTRALCELAATLPAALSGEELAAARRTVDAETIDRHEDRLVALRTEAEAQNVTIVRTPAGYAAAPVLDGKVVKPDVFARLPDNMRKDVEARVIKLQTELADLLAARAGIDKERRTRYAALDRATAAYCVQEAYADVRSAFAGHSDVLRLIADVERGLLADVPGLTARLMALASGAHAPPSIARSTLLADAFWRPWLVHVVAARPTEAKSADETDVTPARRSADETRSVVVLRDATPVDVRGSLTAPAPGLPLDHHCIRGGAAHAADGGTLLIDAASLVRSPTTLTALCDVLGAHAVRPASSDTAPLSPEPMPLTARIVLIGDRATLDELTRRETGLTDHFLYRVECPASVARTKDTERAFAEHAARIIREDALLPFQSDAVALLIEHAARVAGAGDRLSCSQRQLIGLMHKASTLARWDDRTTVTAADVRASQ